MPYVHRWLIALSLLLVSPHVWGDTNESTRPTDAKFHACTLSGGYPYRQNLSVYR